MSAKQPITPKFTLTVFFTTATGERVEVQMSFMVAWAIYRIAKTLGSRYAYLAALGGAIAVTAGQEHVVDGVIVETTSDRELTDEDQRRLEIFTRDVADALVRAWPRQEDMLLKYTYEMLRTGALTRADVAQFASEALGKEIQPDTWKKRLDNYIKREQLDRLELSPGRPKYGK